MKQVNTHDTNLPMNHRQPEDVIWRWVIRKSRPVVEELLKQRPQSMEVAA